MNPTPALRIQRRTLGLPLAAEALLALIGFAVLSLLYLGPFPRVFRDHLTPDLGDSLFNLYVLEWGQHQLRLGLPDLWNAPFFFPIRDSLALSDHLVGPAAQALLLRMGAGTSIAAYNLLLLSALALSGTAVFWVLRQAGASRLASLGGGLAYAFSPYHWSQLSHLQVFLIQWIPLVLWFWYRLLEEPRLRYAVPFLVFYVLHVTGGSYLAYMIHFPLLAVALALRTRSSQWWQPRSRRILLSTGVAAATATTLVFLPYLRADHGLETGWGSENYRVFGASFVAPLTPSPFSPYFDSVSKPLRSLASPDRRAYWSGEKSLFPGFLPALLVLGAVAARIHRHRVLPLREISQMRRAVLALLAFTAALSFVVADAYTLGWLDHPKATPGMIYTLGGLALGVSLTAWVLLRFRWVGHMPIRLSAMSLLDRAVLSTGLLCLALCFPVVFEPLTRVVPGLDRMRVPSRFYVFTTLATAWFAASGLDDLRNRLPRRFAMTTALAIVGAMALELAPGALPWHRVPVPEEFPPVYRWLAERNDVRALVELPMWGHTDELPYMLYSTAHWKPLINGYSARIPPSYLAAYQACSSGLPEPPCLERLREHGVSHVVIHPVWRNPAKHRTFESWIEEVEAGDRPGLRIAYRERRGDLVVELQASGIQASRPTRTIHDPDAVP